jgi:Zn ribbon nucleic-acid-binding protein
MFIELWCQDLGLQVFSLAENRRCEEYPTLSQKKSRSVERVDCIDCGQDSTASAMAAGELVCTNAFSCSAIRLAVSHGQSEDLRTKIRQIEGLHFNYSSLSIQSTENYVPEASAGMSWAHMFLDEAIRAGAYQPHLELTLNRLPRPIGSMLKKPLWPPLAAAG